MAARMFLAFVRRGRLYRCAETTHVLYNFLSINTLLDKVMSRNQWHIGVQARDLVFKGPM